MGHAAPSSSDAPEAPAPLATEQALWLQGGPNLWRLVWHLWRNHRSYIGSMCSLWEILEDLPWDRPFDIVRISARGSLNWSLSARICASNQI